MKLSKRTLTVLQNFSTICPSILIKPGNTIAIKPLRDADAHVYAIADLPDTFPKEIGIYDIPMFLSMVQAMGGTEAEIKFGSGNRAEISNGSSSVHYLFAEPSLLPQPIRMKPMDAIATFELSAERLDKVRKIAATLRCSHIAIEADSASGIRIIASNQENPSSNKFIETIGPTDQSFVAVFDVQSLVMLPDSYNVSVHNNSISFNNLTGDLRYLVALVRKFSKFN